QAKGKRVKRYEGLFILNTAGKEESVKELIDKITAEIGAHGGKVETVQKMDRKAFTRVANKKNQAGFFVNFVFETEPSTLAHLRSKFVLNEEIFRVLFHIAPEPKEAVA